MSTNQNTEAGCIGALLALLIFGPLAGLMFDYVLYSTTGKDVNFLLDILGGLVCNGFIIAVWIVCLILRAAGIEAPFFDV